MPTAQKANDAAVEAEYGPLLDAIDERVDQALTPVREQNHDLHQRLSQLSKPTRDSKAMFEGPAVRRGEDSMSSRGFSFARLAALQNGLIGPEDAKVELSLSRQLRQHYENMGFKGTSSHQSTMLIPLDAAMIPEDAQFCGEDRYSQGDVRQMMAVELGATSPDEIRQTGNRLGLPAARINQALSQFDETGMGVFLENNIGSLIEQIKAVEVLSKIGATTITLPENGFLKFPRQTGAVTSYWVGEKSTITASEPTTGSLELRAKKCAAICVLPSELLRYGGPAVEAFVRADLASELALAVDLAGLEGAGTTTEPKGVLNYANIITHTAGTVATDGNTFQPEDPSRMLAEIEEANFDPDREGFAWLMRGKMWRNILNRRSGALDTSDNLVEGVGQWLFDVNRADISAGQPSMLLGHPVVRSSQVSNTRAKGSATDLSYILGIVGKHLLIGRVGILEILSSNSGTVNGSNLFETDQVALRAIQHVDVGLRHENAVVFCDTLDMGLPA